MTYRRIIAMLVAGLSVGIVAPAAGLGHLGRAKRGAVIRAANAAIHSYLTSIPPEQRRGAEIPRRYWGAAIRKLRPIRVYDDRANVAIVLSEDRKKEEGLYVTVPISTYAPGNDSRFTRFTPLTQPGDRFFGHLYRYVLAKD